MYISGRSCITFLYAVSFALTFPSILWSTGVVTAAAGTLTAILLAYFEQSLVVVAVAAVLVGLCRGRSDLTAKTVWNRFTALTARIYREFNLSLNNRKERSERPDSIFHRQILNLTFGKRFRFSDFFFLPVFVGYHRRFRQR